MTSDVTKMLFAIRVFVVAALLFPVGEADESISEQEKSSHSCYCAPGWNCRFNNNYKYIKNAMSWIDAEFYCQNLYQGAHLASILSEDENDFLKEITFQHTHSYPIIWIGASDCYKDRFFVWTDGSKLNYKNWFPGEPNNNNGREACVNYNFNSPGLWNDEHCEVKFPFICKYTTPYPY
ncbi:lectin-like isoform X2 [Ambystoma mexicanum]|uniref:lectin-like isoform X2 n=1 Tax=Ambystoma mexicanum TaxID=8296 RepID=UPI0037E900A2